MPTVPDDIDALDGLTPPSTSDPANFRPRGDAFLGAFPTLQTQINATVGSTYDNAVEAAASAVTATTKAGEASTSASTATTQAGIATTQAGIASDAATVAVNAPGTGATSTTSHSINLSGPKTFTIQTGKSLYVGQYVMAANTAAPENYIIGQIASHNSGTGALELDIVYAQGSGTYTAWTISLVAYNAIQIEEFNPTTLTTNAGTIPTTATGNYFKITISSSTTFVFNQTLMQDGYSFVLVVDYTSGTITWPASVDWPYDTAPELIAGKKYIFTFVTDDGGTTYRGAVLPEYA